MIQRFFLVFVLSKLAASAWTRGSIEVPAGGTVFLSKFCFDYKEDSNSVRPVGKLQATLHSADPGEGLLKFVLFDDQASSYPDGSAVWGFGCESERLKAAARWTDVINVTTLISGKAPRADIFERHRPRWWYVAIVDCSGTARVLDYTVHMINLHLGFLEEFSMDRIGPAGVYIFMALYGLLGASQMVAMLKRSTSAKTQHPIRLLLSACVGAAAVGTLSTLINTLWYAYHGEDQPNFYLAAKLLKAGSKYMLLAILLLLSRGRCISVPLYARDIWQATRILLPIYLASICLEVWGEYSQSRKYSNDFVYRTPMGLLIISLDIVLFALYLRNLCSSWRSETDAIRQSFYRCWGLIYSGAFLSLPVSVIIVQSFSPWVRSEVVFIVSNTAHCIFLALLIVGLWPDYAQPFFCIDQPSVLAQTFGVKTELLDEGQELWQPPSLNGDVELTRAAG